MKPPLSKNYQNDFQTPAEAIKPLIPYIPKNFVIWECAAGKGNLVKAFENEGYKVIATDILTGQNFLLYEPEEHYDIIVTNPPYSLKNEFLERAYALKKPFAFLLPLTTLESERRQRLFKKFGVELILLNKRINFETPSGSGSGSWFAVAWFCGYMKIGKELNFP